MSKQISRLLSLLFLGLVLAGCNDQVQGQRQALPTEVQDKVLGDCRDIKKTGSLLKLQQSLDRDIASLLSAADHAGPGWERSSYKKSLDDAAAAIGAKIAIIKTLLKPEWNRQTIPTVYKWKIERQFYPQLFLDLHDPSFKILRVDVEGVSTYGVAGGAPPDTEITVTSDQEVELRMLVPSSSYELCELTKALAVRVNVVFAFGGSSGAHEFTLTVPEKEGQL